MQKAFHFSHRIRVSDNGPMEIRLVSRAYNDLDFKVIHKSTEDTLPLKLKSGDLCELTFSEHKVRASLTVQAEWPLDSNNFNLYYNFLGYLALSLLQHSHNQGFLFPKMKTKIDADSMKVTIKIHEVFREKNSSHQLKYFHDLAYIPSLCRIAATDTTDVNYESIVSLYEARKPKYNAYVQKVEEAIGLYVDLQSLLQSAMSDDLYDDMFYLIHEKRLYEAIIDEASEPSIQKLIDEWKKTKSILLQTYQMQKLNEKLCLNPIRCIERALINLRVWIYNRIRYSSENLTLLLEASAKAEKFWSRVLLE